MTRTLFIGLAIAAVTCIPAVTIAQKTSAPVQSPSASALSDTPWYDANGGSLIPINVKERTDDTIHRSSRWLPKAKKIAKPKAPNTPNAAAGGGGTGNGVLGTDLTFMNLVGWMLMALFVTALVGLLVYAISKTEIELGDGKKDVTRVSGQDVDKQTIERMKHLPAELRRTDVNMRTEAERLASIGQYDQAVILLFGHQLLMLDKATMLRLTRGKTNGRYVRETRSQDRDAARSLRHTATAFERSYFGRHDITPAEFDVLWQNNLALEQRIQARAEVAA